ncbi:MAG: hypothetical protein ACP5IA_08330 [Sediminispirochaetaceae bacterium]
MRMQTIQYPTQPTLSPAYMLRARYNGGRISFPVKPSQAIYARFEHVQGFPSSEGNGISLYKLRSIDNLIDRLVSLKENTGSKSQEMKLEAMIKSLEASKSSISEGNFSAVLRESAETLHSMSLSSAPYARKGGYQGLLFSLSA